MWAPLEALYVWIRCWYSIVTTYHCNHQPLYDKSHLDKFLLSEASIIVLVKSLKHFSSTFNRLILSEPLLYKMMIRIMIMTTTMRIPEWYTSSKRSPPSHQGQFPLSCPCHTCGTPIWWWRHSDKYIHSDGFILPQFFCRISTTAHIRCNHELLNDHGQGH